MTNWLRLIRYKNLLIVFLTQLLVWYCLIYAKRFDLQILANVNNRGWAPDNWGFYFSPLQAFLYFLHISVSTVLIAAAGYIINDYFDLKIDLINRPEKMILEKRIPLRTAIITHTIFNIIGFVMAAVVAMAAGHYEWLLMQVACTLLLWFYSTHFKKQFVIGNLVVALLTALTVIVLIIYAPGLGIHFNIRPVIMTLQDSRTIINPLWICFVYAFFAFITTWMREIIKDMEDYKGDAEEGCVTMPIKMGLQFSTRFTQILGVVTIIVLVFSGVYLFLHSTILLGLYLILAVGIPLAWWCYYVTKQNTMQHYHNASKWLKIIMLAGIASLIVYHFTT